MRSFFPASARRLLEDVEAVHLGVPSGPFGVDNGVGPAGVYRFDVSLRTARKVAKTLEDDKIEVFQVAEYQLGYGLGELGVIFRGFLPHGATDCACLG